MAKTKATEMTTVDDQMSLFSQERPDFMGDSNRGSDNVGGEDLSIPRISLIQDLSPQRKKNQPEYIDGAEEGMFFNSVSDFLYGSEFIFIPVYFRKEWVIWMDRDKGGGLIHVAETKEEAEQEYAHLGDREEPVNADDCEITETAQQFGMIMHPDGNLEQIVISMSKSQLTPSRKFNTMINQVGGDRFARAYRVSSFDAEGKKGMYKNFKFHPLGFVPEHVYNRCVEFYEAISSGAVDVSRKPESPEVVESDEM